MKKTMELRRPHKIAAILTNMIVFFSFQAQAAEAPVVQVDVLGGFYSLEAKSRTATGKLDRFGIYKLGVRRALLPQIEFGAAYSLFTSEIGGGDMGFGPDISIIFYPLTTASPVKYRGNGYELNYSETWRPFVFAGFHQRNFQSVNSSYAGFGGGGGIEYYLNSAFSLRSEFRYLSLLGPDKATAKKMDFLIGFTFSL